MVAAMADPRDKQDDRAKRLAEELRKNLRRRKGQAREQDNSERKPDRPA